MLDYERGQQVNLCLTQVGYSSYSGEYLNYCMLVLCIIIKLFEYKLQRNTNCVMDGLSGYCKSNRLAATINYVFQKFDVLY